MNWKETIHKSMEWIMRGWKEKTKSMMTVLGVILLLGFLTKVFGLEEEQPRRSLSFFDVWALPRVWVGALVGLIGLVLLMRKRVTKNLRLLAMGIVFFLFSIVAILPWGKFAEGMGLHPSPMCVIEKSFIFLQMGRAIPIVFISIFVFTMLMTIIGNKLFCGWNCPIGALQEMLHRIPVPNKFKLPFVLSNATRVVVFVAFIGLLFTLGFSIYEYVNPFEFLHWSLEWAVAPAFLVTFVAALFVYRPFCYLICPLGLVTWLAEHISIIRVRVDKKACTECMLCVKKSPCPSVQAILDGKFSRPDCHACGACIEACPENALRFK